jgi:antitoxin (DNA-binding transcriptional repressor) of toxin-antitoxin stability system
MVAVSAKELGERTDALLHLVQERGESVEIVVDGRVVARLVPVDEEVERIKDRQTAEALAELDRIGQEFAASVPAGTTLDDLLRDMRRDL